MLFGGPVRKDIKCYLAGRVTAGTAALVPTPSINDDAMQAWLDECRYSRRWGYIADGTYRFEAMMHQRECQVTGQSKTGVILQQQSAITNPGEHTVSTWRMGGAGTTVRVPQTTLANVTIDITDALGAKLNNRGTVYGIYIFLADGFQVSNVDIDGACGASLLIQRSSNGVVDTVEQDNGLADAFHVTDASHHIKMRNLTATSSGDDYFANVNSENDADWVEYIHWENCTGVTQASGRGFVVDGGRNITADTVDIQSANSRGVYLVSDSGFSSRGVFTVALANFTIANTANNNGGGEGVYIGGRTGLDKNGSPKTVEDVTLTNFSIHDTPNDSTGRGFAIGRPQTGQHSLVKRVTIDGFTLDNIHGNAFHVSGVEDLTVQNGTATDIDATFARYEFTTAFGTHTWSNIDVDDIGLDSTTNDVFAHAAACPTTTWAITDVVHTQSGGGGFRQFLLMGSVASGVVTDCLSLGTTIHGTHTDVTVGTGWTFVE